MNYIGSKSKLSNFIKQSIYSVVGNDLSQKIFCDLFAGTGIIGRNFKSEVKQIISNDIEYYSFVLNRNYIENHQFFEYNHLIKELNNIKGIQGFIFEEYSENGKAQRLYFSETNGKKIDAIRQKIENWKIKKYITDNQYYFLLASLLESADKVANTASVYGAFLKHIKKSAQKEIIIEPAIFTINDNNHQVFNDDSNELIKKISGDILYLDPPYNARQYGANYHLLNTIAKYDTFTPKGKTGLRNYNKSSYCSKNSVKESFENLIKNSQFKYIFLSYNNEGLMNSSEIKSIMSKYGTYDLFSIDYQRFKADKENNRNHKASSTIEYLHFLEIK
ncbi:DNA adenine methylase [Riemerella anatipestifer]|uniref:site-specific DNA-methyltransferase (adenine-specific) n=2 Tax=Riemerella anatipestifer TaxID=34085 RepID=J9R5P8_RIEAN|nr:DNA adenine methylase [Riemerella anatipestifer]AFR35778.1 Adenine-specific DNA methylase [Riemerella anatipestifer RA-CH-1]AIH02827.1 site-specific DNA-methyltransferase (adenine-specific) [Riemerella anatipestifer CH3]AQY21551.1 Modification methylase FokI [Riemerella anatipestifer]MBO4233931.1 modification methylase [Riemerella anatipestifer]MBT0549821.1 DNA adenine methylase [Riemerella anatipestifer]